MITAHTITGDLSVLISGNLQLAPDIEEEIDTIWSKALAERPNLFDGPIVTVTSMSSNMIHATRASYRHSMAARLSHNVRDIIRLRPLAVSGIVESPDGLVFGLRGGNVTQGVGRWELVPSGGVQPPAYGNQPDLVGHILGELAEETGISRDGVSEPKPIGIVEDAETGVIDIVLAMSTDYTRDEIVALHAQYGSREYSKIFVGSKNDLQEDLLPESAAIIQNWLESREFTSTGTGQRRA